MSPVVAYASVADGGSAKKNGAGIAPTPFADTRTPPHTAGSEHDCESGNDQNDIGTLTIKVTSGVSRVTPAPTATLRVFLSVRR